MAKKRSRRKCGPPAAPAMPGRSGRAACSPDAPRPAHREAASRGSARRQRSRPRGTGRLREL
eukprot:scaffold14355_cov105-Isochrysis_galbana.AAC.3